MPGEFGDAVVATPGQSHVRNRRYTDHIPIYGQYPLEWQKAPPQVLVTYLLLVVVVVVVLFSGGLSGHVAGDRASHGAYAGLS